MGICPNCTDRPDWGNCRNRHHEEKKIITAFSATYANGAENCAERNQSHILMNMTLMD
jgi:hypothetical protein